jgi:multicomponent Na+:H+ antiporter subunit G
MAGTVLEVLGAAVLLVGLTLATIGLYGMARKPDIFDQLHAAGLVTGPGIAAHRRLHRASPPAADADE